MADSLRPQFSYYSPVSTGPVHSCPSLFHCGLTCFSKQSRVEAADQGGGQRKASHAADVVTPFLTAQCSSAAIPEPDAGRHRRRCPLAAAMTEHSFGVWPYLAQCSMRMDTKIDSAGLETACTDPRRSGTHRIAYDWGFIAE